jgi:hypothetical protein
MITYSEPSPELEQRGDARVARFTRVYDAPVDDVWDACTNPERLARWYVPVTGDLRLGGRFEQAMMGSGEIVACAPPHRLRLSLGGGVDEIDLRLEAAGDGTRLVLEHATTADTHVIGGQRYDAIFCMGGGYYPRLLALDRHLRGTLPADYDTLTFYQREDVQPVIARGSAAMQALLDQSMARR